MDLAREDVIWFAGLFEGEGCLSAVNAKDKKIPQWRMSVKMTDKDIMDRIHNTFGGNLNSVKVPNHYKDTWVWSLNATLAYALCAALYPFMGERRKSKFKEFMLDFAARPPNTPSARAKAQWNNTLRR